MPERTAAIDLLPGDAQALLELLAARDGADYGEEDFTRSVLLDALRTGDFDPARDAVVAAHGDERLGGVALLAPGALAFVTPPGEGRGAGSRLLRWVEERAEDDRRSIHRQRCAAGNHRARGLLLGAGYRHVRTVHHMSIDLHEPLAAPPVPGPGPGPAGVEFRPLDVARDAQLLHEADNRMFAHNADYEPEPFEAFRAEHLLTPDLAPELSTVARRDGRVAGFTLCRRYGDGLGLVDLLAVDPAQRRRGLGRALLLGSFRAFAAAGLREARLDVASDNAPGLALYASAGMAATRGTEVYEKPITPG